MAHSYFSNVVSKMDDWLMRILHLIPKLSNGGTEKQLEYLNRGLISLGHDVHIAYLNESENYIIHPNVILHKLKAKSNHDPLLLIQVRRLIKRIQPDVLHTWILQMDIIGGLAALISGIPFILREPSSEMAYKGGWKNRLRVLIGQKANAIVANSLGGVEYWKKFAPGSKCYKISNGVPLDEINAFTGALPEHIKTDLPIVLYVGRLAADVSASKNLINLLKAVSIVCKTNEVLCILCGDGPQISSLQLLSKDLGLKDNILFTKHLSASAVWTLMKKSTIFISLSEYEGCPNSVLEAIACGCPLVLSDIPAHREILSKNQTKFVDHTNVQLIADSIVKVLRHSDKSKEQAIINKQIINEWSIGKMTQEFLKVYNAVKK